MQTFHPELIKVERIQEGHREHAARRRLLAQTGRRPRRSPLQVLRSLAADRKKRDPAANPTIGAIRRC